MADIDTAREEVDELANAGQNAENAVETAKNIGEMASNIADYINDKKSDNGDNADIENNDGYGNSDDNNINPNDKPESHNTANGPNNSQNQNQATQQQDKSQNKDNKSESNNKSNDKNNGNSESSKDAKNQLSGEKKSTDGTNALKDLAEKGKDGIKNVAEGAKNAADGIKSAAEGMSGGITGTAIDKAVDGLAGSGVSESSENATSAEAVNEIANKGKEVVKDVAKIAAGLATGDVSTLASGALGLLKKVAIIIAAFIMVPIALVMALILIIIVIFESVGGLIANAITNFTESINELAGEIPEYFKKDTEFTMEQQYELIAKAFGDGVQQAYEEMMAEIKDEIDSYENGEKAGYENINEWDEIINYNKQIGRFKGCLEGPTKFEAGTEVSSFDNVKIKDDNDKNYLISLPTKDGDAVMPYIGGYNESKPNTYFGTGWKGKFDKGLWVVDATADTPASSRYATGKENWFNKDKAVNDLQNTIAYQAVSDMAYLVAGYSVSMMEDSIVEAGEKVSQLQLDVSAIQYEVDIRQRIFQQQVSISQELFAGGNWLSGAKELLKGVFNQDTYFNYDADEISVTSKTEKRIVMKYKEYGEKTISGKKYRATVSIKYKSYHSSGHHGQKSVPDGHKWYCLPGCTTSHTKLVNKTCSDVGCPGYSVYSTSKTIYVTIPASDIAGAYKPDGTIDNTKMPSINDSKYSTMKDNAIQNALDSVSNKTGEYTVYGWYAAGDDSSNQTLELFAEYVPTEVNYTEATLDIPMSPFDVDKMMKMLFETSPYYTEITKYYTDEELTYNVPAGEMTNPPKQTTGEDDEILEYYGKYIAEWKYCYFDDHEIDYGSFPAGKVTYNKGDIYDNGIDSQPYFTFDEMYQYDCDCDPHFGMDSKCPQCGAEIIRSNKIGKDKGNAAAKGERPVSQMSNPMIKTGSYFGLCSALINLVTGVNPMDAIRAINQPMKENEMMARTTTDKTVLDNYTGDQTGGNIGQKPGAIEVVLTHKLPDGSDEDYYPITVEDKVLELKDSMLNILENTDTIQGIYSAIGLSYGNMFTGQNWNGGTITIDGSGVDQYVLDMQGFSSSDYTRIDTTNGTVGLGIANFVDADASQIVTEGVNANPEIFAITTAANDVDNSNVLMSLSDLLSSKKALAATMGGLTKEQFLSNWSKLGRPQEMDDGVSPSEVRAVLQKILESTHNTQNTKYKEKVNKTVKYLMDVCQVSDPATLCYLTNVITQMKLSDVSDIGKAGQLSTFRDQVILPGIAAGADKSLETTHTNLQKWITTQQAKGNTYVSSSMSSTANETFTKVKADKEADKLPWITSGVAPEDVQQVVDFAKQLCAIANKTNTVYGQGNSKYPAQRMTGKTCWDAMEKLVSTGQGVVSTDCSAFVQALYWKLGYNVPGSSGAWIQGGHQYVAKTDMASMIPGDVIVWGAKSGHVEIYIGNNQSIGFGSAPPKIHSPWNTNYFVTHYGACRYYRIVK